ncbi:MAG: hypothetical protein RBT80_17700 [Candidatus Vecturithrix sp.]|jgi:methyl-accepting chemotaxis protein|nr:hypothetical protein [Candidatus Vecturithrix sp.]
MGALGKMVARLTEALQTVNTLVHAVRLGKLDVRGNIDKMSGGWRDLVLGVNEVVVAFVEPVDVAATIIEQVAQGSIP